MAVKRGRPSLEDVAAKEASARQFGEGRVCAGRTCNTILSRYNESEWCSLCIRVDPLAKGPKVMVRGKTA